MITWQQVVDAALRLSGSELSTSYGRPAIKVRKKMFACTGKEDDHFLIMIGHDEANALIENHPATFFRTPHYDRSNAVLIHYQTADPAQIELLLQRAWTQRSKK